MTGHSMAPPIAPVVLETSQGNADACFGFVSLRKHCRCRGSRVQLPDAGESTSGSRAFVREPDRHLDWMTRALALTVVPVATWSVVPPFQVPVASDSGPEC